jgi:hypothetical protein
MSSQPVTLRSSAEVAAFTAGLELVPPGLLPVNEWRPTFGGSRLGQPVPVYAVLARKPALRPRRPSTHS